jgi:16S rRNA (uracil1498-N3)-methyltransferase
MRVPRFPTTLKLEDNTATLTGESQHHLTNVLRTKVGSKVELFDTQSQLVALATINKITPSDVYLTIDSITTATLAPPVHLLCAIIKPKLVDFICEKAVELGISHLHFFTAERSQIKSNKLRPERIDRVLEAAAKQCGATHIPEVSIDNSLKETLDTLHFQQENTENTSTRLKIVCVAPSDDAENNLQPTLITTNLKSFEQKSTKNTNPLEKLTKCAESYVLVGAEGGFTQAEHDCAKHYGYSPVNLGPNTLRAETAAIVACSTVVLHVIGVTTEGRD